MNAIARMLGIGCLGMALVLTWTLEAKQAQAQGSIRLRPPRASSVITESAAQQAVAEVTETSNSAVGTGILTARRPMTFGFGGAPSFSRGFVPRHERVYSTSLAGGTVTEEIQRPAVIAEDGSIKYQALPSELGGCASCGAGGCASCGAGGYAGARGCLIPCPWLNLKNFQFFAGVQGFKGPGNLGSDGSFGFHEGLNWVGIFPCLPAGCISTQFGFQATQNNFSGASFTTDKREQIFTTGGIFRRVDWGLQWGVVFDYMHDEWDVNVDLTQIRSEISWVYPRGDEFGFMGAFSTRQGHGARPALGLPTLTLETTDIYAFFYRVRFLQNCGGEGRIFGGFSGKKDGIVGGDIFLPLSDRWAFQSDFTYLIPEESNTGGTGPGTGIFGESWNVAFNLVWFPRGCASVNAYNRPLFNVANNGSMLINNR